MIGNLGNICANILNSDGNDWNSGNTDQSPTQLGKLENDIQFPMSENDLDASGTRQQMTLPFLEVPVAINTNGNNGRKQNKAKKLDISKLVPVEPDIPVINLNARKVVFGQVPRGQGIWKIADICGERVDVHSERNACYCCKGTEFWALEANSSANWICSRCHPPVVDSKKIIWRRSASLQTGDNQLTASKPNLMALRLIGELRKALDDINAIFPGPDCWQWIQQQPEIIDSLQSVKPLINAPFLPENEPTILETITKWKSIHINAFITYQNRK